MKWQANLPHVKFKLLTAQNVPHAITTREWGSLNPFVGYEWSRRLQKGVTPSPPIHQLVIAEEIHEACVHVCSPTDGGSIRLGVDGLISDDPHLLLMVYASDCVPLLLYDLLHKVVAVLHGSRRSLLQGLVERTASIMEKRFGTAMANVIVGIGPALRGCCYEIREDILPELEAAEWMPFVKTVGNGLRLDMIEGCKSILLASGIAEQHIEDSGLCTFDDSARFFSYRNRLTSDERGASLAALISAPE